MVGTSRAYPGTIEARVRAVLREQIPVDLIFVHRDADQRVANERLTEIDKACRAAGAQAHVPIVPISGAGGVASLG